jgi:hypothetical protein
MFYAKSLNCCQAVRTIMNSGPDGGSCPPFLDETPCRGFAGECSLIPDQFADVPVLPDFPDGLADWSCTAFPDDDKPLDSFLARACSAERMSRMHRA